MQHYSALTDKTFKPIDTSNPLPVKTTNSIAYDATDDMYKIKSIQKKWRDSFTSLLSNNWDVTESNGSTATISGGVLTLSSGTTAGGYCELLSKETFTVPFRAMFGVQNGRNANNHHIIEAVSVNSVTGIPDGKHSMAFDIGGAASVTATQGIYYVQNGGLIPLASAVSTITTTASYSILELEPFSDECYFHSRTIDATSGRANSYVRHQQIPDPNALYKLRIRSQNHAAYKAVSGAVSGTGNAIRLTVTAHGYSSANTVWVDCLNGVTNNGAEVRGNYVITVVDVNTIELNGTTFLGIYVSNSGRVALASTPTAVTMQFQFLNCQDYAELTAEITAGRGQIVQGQSLGVQLTNAIPAGTAAIGTVTVAGQTAHAAAITGNPVRLSGRALTANYTAVTNGQVADLITTLVGALIQKPYSIPEQDWQFACTAAVANTTDVAVKAAGAAGIRNYVTAIQFSNTNAVATEIQLKDGATVIWRGYAPANMLDTITVTFTTPLRGTAATAVNFACVTTAASVYVNAQGYQAP